MVQVYVEVSGNLPVVFYVKQGQGDKERLDLDKDINTTPWSSRQLRQLRGKHAVQGEWRVPFMAVPLNDCDTFLPCHRELGYKAL